LCARSTTFNARRLTDKTGAEHAGLNGPLIPLRRTASSRYDEKPSGYVMAAVARGANGAKS
ncbi:hypothetical protein, partial [Paraburkholderia podalyriae]|uniref:hypothetical protein n=1 Tax=Paraburkholderia podalyriae TaxID=1938811 RepID=UPI001CA3CB4E